MLVLSCPDLTVETIPTTKFTKFSHQTFAKDTIG